MRKVHLQIPVGSFPKNDCLLPIRDLLLVARDGYDTPETITSAALWSMYLREKLRGSQRRVSDFCLLVSIE
jgi:hypothetical protein